MRAQLNRFTSKCSYCTKDMEPESGVILPNDKGGADAAYHFTCLDIMLSLKERKDVIQGRDGVWSTPETANKHTVFDVPPRKGVVPPRRKPQ